MWYSTNWQRTGLIKLKTDDWAPMSKFAAAFSKHSAVLQSHIIRSAWRLQAGKVDKLADKARAQIFKRPDVVQWIEDSKEQGYDKSVRYLQEFFDKAPSDAYKLYPWMWTQIRNSPGLLSSQNSQGKLYEVGQAFQALNRNNKPTPDIHKLDYEGAFSWLDSDEVQSMLNDLRPVPWEDPEHHFTVSDNKHVIHRITNAEDAKREGEMMGHCVGGYGGKIESGDTNIFSLRDEKHRPHVTIELQPVGYGRPAFDTSNLQPGFRFITPAGGDRPSDFIGGTIIERGPEFGQYTVRIDGQDEARVVNQAIVRGPYPLAFKVGDMVQPGHRIGGNVDGDPGPYEIVGIGRNGDMNGYGYYLDMSTAGGSSRYFLPSDGVLNATGEQVEDPYIHQPKSELPTEHRVTQVFGKGDQAPIGKYRKMVKEFFDDLRSKGHTLHWAGNEFLPDNVSSLTGAEEVWEMLDDLHSHLQEQGDNTTDPLAIAHSLVESGDLAGQYGFETKSGEAMQVNWQSLIEDFAEEVADGNKDAEDAINWIEAVAAVKGVPHTELKQILSMARETAQEYVDYREMEMRDNDADHDWGHLTEEKDRILSNKMDDYFHHVDHGSERAYTKEQMDIIDGEEPEDEDEYAEWQDRIDSIHDDATDQYEEFKDEHDDDAREEAREQWDENWEPYSDEHRKGLDAIDDLETKLSNGVEQNVSRVLRLAMDKNASDAAVNNEWENLQRQLAKKPSFYATLTHSLPNLVRRATEHAKKEVARHHDALGWQQVMPKGEQPLRNTTERTEQLVEALERLQKQVHADGGPDFSGTHSDPEWRRTGTPRWSVMQAYIQQHSLDQPFHSAIGNPTPKTDALRNQFGQPGQRDMLVDYANDQVRPNAQYKDMHGTGLVIGDQVRHPQYGVGEVQYQTPNELQVHFPTNGTTLVRGPEVQQLQRVGSTDWSVVSGWKRTAASIVEAAKSERIPFRVYAQSLKEVADATKADADKKLNEWFQKQLLWSRDQGHTTDEEIASESRKFKTRLQIILTQLPDEAYKMIPWLAKRIKKGDIDLTNYGAGGYSHNVGHIADVLGQFFEVAKQHKRDNKPVPDFNQISLEEMEKFTQEAYAAGSASQWTDSHTVFDAGNGWVIQRVGPADLGREGDLMGHCVGGYCNAVSSGESTIYSLRDPKGQPHVTIELQGEHGDFELNAHDRRNENPSEIKVVQVQGKGNADPKPEYQEMVDAWLGELEGRGYEIDKSKSWEELMEEPEYDHVDTLHLNSPRQLREYHDALMNRPHAFVHDEDGTFEPEYGQAERFVHYSEYGLKADPLGTVNMLPGLIRELANTGDTQEAFKYAEALWLGLGHMDLHERGKLGQYMAQRGVTPPVVQPGVWDAEERGQEQPDWWTPNHANPYGHHPDTGEWQQLDHGMPIYEKIADSFLDHIIQESTAEMQRLHPHEQEAPLAFVRRLTDLRHADLPSFPDYEGSGNWDENTYSDYMQQKAPVTMMLGDLNPRPRPGPGQMQWRPADPNKPWDDWQIHGKASQEPSEGWETA